MAAKDREREYDFVEQPPEEFFCPVSFAVLLEPYLTQCCGNHLLQEAYQRLQGQPCPVCREENLAAMKDNFHKRKVLSLKVRCPHKAEGCEWQGELRSLEQHVAQSCGLKVIRCDFSYAGCGAQLQRRLMSAHMKEGMEAHLSLLSLVAQEVPKLQTVVQQQTDLVKKQDDQLKQQGDQMKQQGDQMKLMADLIKQQGDLIKQMENRIKQLEKPLPPVDIIMDDFEQHKKSNDIWYSPPFYTHLGGYRMCLRVDANGVVGGKGTHVSVHVYLMRGEFDDLLKWPFRGEVTIQLKKNDPPHYQKILHLSENDHVVCKPTKERNDGGWGYDEYISHADLYAGGYLKDDKLVFCVSDIVVRSK